MKLWHSRVARLPRAWSNAELRRFGQLFTGDIVNVSGWKDGDKEGGKYRDYFPRAQSYSITNFSTKHRGFQGTDGEIFLDLSVPLRDELAGRFDVVFNHTVLEHIYECQVAFSNLCKMTRDVVVIVLPFLQPYHSPYGDYWRFSPLAVSRMFEDNGMTLLHCSFNEHYMSSVYLFAIGAKHPERLREHFPNPVSVSSPITGQRAGARAIPSLKAWWRASGKWP
jgi:hypothetical protein